MKQNAISKINKVGKIGSIFTIILKIFIIIGIVGTLIGTIIFSVIPKELLTANVDSNILFTVDTSSLGELTDKEVEDVQKEIKTTFQENDDSAFDSLNAVNVTKTGLSLDFTVKSTEFSAHNFIWLMLSALLYLIMTLITVFFIGSLCKAFQHCASPFEDSVIRKMKALAYSLIPWVILTSLFDSVANGFLYGSLKIEGITVGINLNMVLTVLIILALSYIFQYGAVLQKESDETL